MSKQNLKENNTNYGEQFISCLKIEWLGFVRKKSFFCALILYLLVSLHFFLITGRAPDIQHSVYTAEYIQVLVMALSGAVGIYIGGMEHNCSYFDVMMSFNMAKHLKVAAKILTAAVFASVCYVIISFVVVISSILKASALCVVINCLQFLFLRIFLPSFIFALIGIAIGYQVKSQLKYAVWLLVTFVFSPIFTHASSYVFIAFNSNSRLWEYVLSMFNMGSFNTNISEVYGHPIELPFWIYMITVAILAVSYCVAVYSDRHFSRRRHFVVTGLFLAVYIGGLCLSYNPFTYTFFVNYGYGYKSNLNYDEEILETYYDNEGLLREKDIPYSGMDMERHLVPSSWKVKLTPGSVMLGVEAELEAVAKEAFDWQSFTLYHNYDIKNISVNGKKSDFVRNNNYLSVKMPKGIAEGDTVKIKFVYSGLSSPTEPGNKYVVSLTSDFPWLPRIGITELSEDSIVVSMLKLYASEQKIEDDVQYTLYFDSDYVVYTNLEQTAKGVYQGCSDTGVTVVAYGLQSKKQIGDVTVYYPASVESELDMQIETFRASSVSMKDFFAFFGMDEAAASIESKADTVVVLPTSFSGDYYQTEGFYLDNTYIAYYWNAGLISYIRTVYDDLGSIVNVDTLINYQLSKIQPFDNESSDYFIKVYMMYWYNEHCADAIRDPSLAQGDQEVRLHEMDLLKEKVLKDSRVANRLIYMENEGNDEEIREFLKDWCTDRMSGICYTDEQLLEKLNAAQ